MLILEGILCRRKVKTNLNTLYSQICQWIESGDGVMVKGKLWTPITYETMMRQFPSWSFSTVRRLVGRLRDSQSVYIIRGQHLFRGSRDSTLHYHIPGIQKAKLSQIHISSVQEPQCPASTPPVQKPPQDVPKKQGSEGKVNICNIIHKNNINNINPYKSVRMFKNSGTNEEGEFSRKEGRGTDRREESCADFVHGVVRSIGTGEVLPRYKARYMNGDLVTLSEQAMRWLELKTVQFKDYVKTYIKRAMECRVIRNKIAYAKTILIEIWKKETGKKHSTSFQYNELLYEAVAEKRPRSLF